MASKDNYKNMSRILSRVMDDIGVNEEAVMGRRRAQLISETLLTLAYYLRQKNDTIYILGSQTEGTTTDGLQSDYDLLIVAKEFNLIQDLNDWAPDKINLLLIQDKKFLGYGKVQVLKFDGPYPEDVLLSDGFTLDEAGRVLLPHNLNDENLERHGPAETLTNTYGNATNDFIHAIRCKTWPNGYKMWSTDPRKGTWPTPEMISYMENSGCFVVQVAHRLDEKKSESWRISTSLAERCLMFSLNITQIRCYTLIKMIVKTFIYPVIPDVITSYICKNLLFHCIENTMPEFWQESNLLRCVNQILLIMLEVIRCMNCPNYFNESINLLLGKINKDTQVVLMSVIWKVLISEGGFVWEIRFDNVNELIHNYDENIYQRKDCSRAKKCKDKHTLYNKIMPYVYAFCINKQLMLGERLSQRNLISLQKAMLLFALQGPLQYASATLLFPCLCSDLSTLKASEHILHGEMPSSRTSLLYERSLDSDMASSRLKFASYMYCIGRFEMTMSVIDEVKSPVKNGCIEVCACDHRKGVQSRYINMDPSLLTQCLFPSHLSMCVVFSQAKRRCCPRELQYEMYRSTEQEKLQRYAHRRDEWMNLACINSIPYLCFLLYVTSRHLGLRELSLKALEQAKKCTTLDGHHRETAYNLLGQCYEYENRFEEALACYCKSLRVRPTNNAASLHIVLLLNTVYQNK